MRLIDADALNRRLATLDQLCRTDKMKALLGRVLFIVSKAPTVSGWISVKDRLPDKYLDVLILVQCPDNISFIPYVAIAWKSTDDDSWDSDCLDFNDDTDGIVTHWMPLPELPK